MKQGARILGIDDSPFDKQSSERVLTVGVVWRAGIVEGVLSTRVERDGSDSTEKLIELVERSRFKEGLRAILINSITLAGFNIVDINKLSEVLEIPVISIVRRKPDLKKVKKALVHSRDYAKALSLIEKAGVPVAVNKFHVQFAGADLETVEKILRVSGIEPVRLAHIIASGIVKGESKGRM
ncbi:DUF99 family protein [Candidatus Micrarchaeota archaeon]|nr:DUF99 family protein [Candidatus Micrarchaeota archaeon]